MKYAIDEPYHIEITTQGDDEAQSTDLAWVTWVLIAINVLIFLYEINLPQSQLTDLIRQYGLRPASVAQGVGLWTLLTAPFIHGGWIQLISYMLVLGLFGRAVERRLGHLVYCVFYIAGGLLAWVPYILLASDTDTPIVGASGAIAAVLGAYFALALWSRLKTQVLSDPRAGILRVLALVLIGVWAIAQLFSALAGQGVLPTQIDLTGVLFAWVHVGGFVFGLVVGSLFRDKVATQLSEN